MEWGTVLREYMEVAERKMIAGEYLKTGAITKFSGVRFSEDNPYSLPEARRLLDLLVKELSDDTELMEKLGTVRKGRDEKANKGGGIAWDVFILSTYQSDPHKKRPHYTVAIKDDHVQATVSMPNGMKPPRLGSLLKGKGESKFRSVLERVCRDLEKALGKVGGDPFGQVLQRRFKTQKSIPEEDAKLEFDLRAGDMKNKAKLKYQQQWIDCFVEVAKNKKANIFFAVGVRFFYKKCDDTKSPKLKKHIATALCKCKPVMDFLVQKSK